MQRRAYALTAVILSASLAQAQEITGTYSLSGEQRAGGSYSGQVRIDADGDELVLSTTFEGERDQRPQLRGSATAMSDGCYRFPFPSEPTPTTGMSSALDELLTTGRRGASSAATSEQRFLYVKPKGEGLVGYVRTGGRTISRERYTPRTVTELTVTALRPSLRRFLPHHPSNNTVEVRYRLEPVDTPLQVTVEVADRDGAVVHRERVGEVSDTGEGALFSWDGEAGRGYVDCLKSPYRITVVAAQGERSSRSRPVEVTAVPLIDRCFVVSRDGSGSLTSAGKIVAHDADVRIVGIVRAIVGGARAADRGRTNRAYFVVDSDLGEQRVRLRGEGRVRLRSWNASWGALRLRWEQVVALGLHAPAFRATQNSRRSTRDGEFTNVVSNGDNEGTWLGRDVLEYEHRAAGFGAGPRQDTTPGTTRYRFDADYSDRDLALGAKERPGSYGKRAPGATTSARVHSGLSAADTSRSLGGAHPRIHRISRRGASPSALLSYLECFRRVPWIYGSLGNQSLGFIGYDCADLVTAAARHAGLTRTGFTNANNLCRRRTRNVGSNPRLKWNSSWQTVSASSGELNLVRCQGGANDARPGDVVFFDWDSDGKYDHTVVLWECPSGTIDRSTRFAWAHHESGSTDGFYVGSLSELVHESSRERVTMWIRRF